MSKTLLDFEQMYLFFYSQVDYRILTLKYAFSINTFDIKNIDFTSGDEEQKKKQIMNLSQRSAIFHLKRKIKNVSWIIIIRAG